MVHFKHKTYPGAPDKSPEELIKKIEVYLTKQRDLELFYNSEENGELLISARPKHDIANRLVGTNYSVCCGVRIEKGKFFVRVGDPCLVLGTGIFGLFKANEVFSDMWAIIDNYLS